MYDITLFANQGSSPTRSEATGADSDNGHVLETHWQPAVLGPHRRYPDSINDKYFLPSASKILDGIHAPSGSARSSLRDSDSELGDSYVNDASRFFPRVP